MMKSAQNAAAVTLLLLTTSCTSEMGEFVDNVHYVFPNSNVIPLSKVSGESDTKWSFIVPSRVDKEMLEEAKHEALKGIPEADIIINAVRDSKTTMIPMPYGLNIFFSSASVEGTAAKMIVGKKELFGVEKAKQKRKSVSAFGMKTPRSKADLSPQISNNTLSSKSKSLDKFGQSSAHRSPEKIRYLKDVKQKITERSSPAKPVRSIFRKETRPRHRRVELANTCGFEPSVNKFSGMVSVRLSRYGPVQVMPKEAYRRLVRRTCS